MKVIQFILIITVVLGQITAPAQLAGSRKDAAESDLEESRESQRKKTDSLRVLLTTRPQDTNTVKLLNLLSASYNIFSYDTSVLYANNALELAGKIKYPEGMINAYIMRGIADESFRNDWETAIAYYRKAIAIGTEYKKYELLHQLYTVIHNAFVYSGNFPQAMNIAKDGLALASKQKNKVQMIHYTSLAGAAYFRQGIYDKSLAEYEVAATIAAKLTREEERLTLRLVALPDIHCGMGDVFTATGDTTNAMLYLRKALMQFTNLQKDTFFIRPYMIPNTLYKMALVSSAKKNLPEALAYCTAALDSTQYINCNKYDIAGYYLLAGEILRQLKRLPESKIYLHEGFRIAQQIKHAENMRDGSRYLSLLFADEKKFDSAWYYNQQYVVLKDSITNVISRFRTEEIKAVYDVNQKNKVIAKQTNTRNILIASFAILLISMGFLYNWYRLRQKNKYQQELNRQQNELFNAVSLAQEQERKRIAQDIHDSLGSILSAAKLKLAEVKEQKPELVSDQKFAAGVSLIDEASSELRSISHNIMPATLSKLGLVPAIQNLVEKISSHKGLQVQFIAHEFEGRLDEEKEISVYRIILELINNVVKHADATKATIQVIKHPAYLNITVEDNGKGFEICKTTDDRTGIGIGNVTSRVEYLKGKIDIDSSKGKGTTVVVDVPL